MALTLPGTPYVEASDLVAAYPAASENLADRVDLVGVLPFATSAARATAIPTPTDGQFTYLQDTNTPEFYNGTAYQAIGGGKILQVISTTKTDTFTTTSTSYVDVTGFSVTITPTSATSKVLIFGMIDAKGTINTNGAIVKLIKNATQISASTADGSRDTGLAMIEAAAATNAFVPINFLDSPNTTSATTYKIQIRTNVSATTAFVNRTATDTNSAVFSRAVSTITVMEVAA